MDNTSPLKNWVNRHSPLKNRHKPLPPPPASSSPLRQPIASVSGNVSPPKPKANKFLSLLRGPKAAPAPPTDSAVPRTPIHKRHFLSAKGRTPDLRTLSRKVSNLESQLKEARRDLDAVVVASTSSSSAHKASPSASASEEIDRQVEERQESLTQRGRFDGLVENLLAQRIDSTTRPVSRRGHAEATNTWAQYAAAEDAYDPIEVDVKTPRSGSLKRKHDEATWREMQNRIARFQHEQEREHEQQPEAKRSKRVLTAPALHPPRRDSLHKIPDALTRNMDEITSDPSSGFDDDQITEPMSVVKPCTSASAPSSHHVMQTRSQKSITTPATIPEDQEGLDAAPTDESLAAASARAKNRLSHLQRPVAPMRLSKVIEEFEWNDEEIF